MFICSEEIVYNPETASKLVSVREIGGVGIGVIELMGVKGNPKYSGAMLGTIFDDVPISVVSFPSLNSEKESLLWVTGVSSLFGEGEKSDMQPDMHANKKRNNIQLKNSMGRRNEGYRCIQKNLSQN